MEFKAGQIAAMIGGTVEGNPEVAVSSFAKIEEAGAGAITFLANPKYIYIPRQPTSCSCAATSNPNSPCGQP